MHEINKPSRITSGPTLRVFYIGPNMDIAKAAYSDAHQNYGHEVWHVASVDELKRLPAPDVAVTSPIVMTSGGIDGACALHAVIPDSTLIVALYTSLGSSYTMYTQHALEGDCHPRMLLHYPHPTIGIDQVVETIDRMARGLGGGPTIQTTGQLPKPLTEPPASIELGKLLSRDVERIRNAGDALTYARLLYVAATDPTWSTVDELAHILGFNVGHLKNRRASLGKALQLRLLDGDSRVGLPQPGRPWRIAEFTRFVTEHRIFIRSYCEHHIPEAIVEQQHVTGE